MVRDLAAPRRTPARASSASEAGNDENAPGNASDVAAAAAAPDPARPPLLAIQPPASCGLKRKPESPAPTPSKLPFRTPEKAAARSRFGWAPPRCEEQPPRAGAGATPYSAMTTPRAHRGKAPVAAASEGGSTQSTPTKSVSKPAYSIGMSGSRPPMSGGGPRGTGLGLGFSTTMGRGGPLSLGPATVVNSAEVPHFKLREDPSFWMDNNVQVVIRVRPLNHNERNLHSYNRCLKQESAQTITWIGQPETRFTFDHVACETVDQEVLFRVAGLPMVENCMAGYNSCVFAYGQTGSGKTYTMLGEISDLEVRPSPDRGMTPRIFEFLFARIRAVTFFSLAILTTNDASLEEESRRDEKLKYSCKCSFLEIYNEQITDLLDPSSTNLQLREDIRKEVYVENLTEYEVGCVSDIIKLLMQGSANRKVAATNMNRESSRSHSVFTCIIESRWEKDSASNLRFARLNLVDLAGSERQRTSGAEGERLKEAANINKSLSTLGLVIMNLVDLAHGKQRHVPYRDSRLTFLLQDSLGGNSKTMIIANVSPSVCSANETLSTLKFAQRARLIQNNAVVNEDASGDVLALQHQIRLLKEELAVLKRQHVTRSLSFSADIFGGDVNDGSMADNDDNDANKRGSLKYLQIPNMQLRSLEEALAGALRRESTAENTIRELETEIEKLNELVRQREDDTRSAKMMLKFRDEKIHRMDALVNNKLPAESYLLEENKTLSQEIDLLRARLDKNPEVTRFALENIRLSSQLKRSEQFFDEGERELLLSEISELRNQVSQILKTRIETEQQNIFPAKFMDSQHNCIDLESDAEILRLFYPSFHVQLKRTSQELEACRGDLQVCLESNRKLTREMEEAIHQLELQLDQSKSYLAHLSSQTQDKDKSSLSVSPEETTCQNSDLNLEDRVDLRALEAFQPVEQKNAEVICKLSKEVEYTVLGMKMVQSQMARQLQENENLKEGQRKIKDLRGEVLKLNSEIIEKDRYYEARLKELELKIQGNEASLISWNKEKEALEHEISEANLLVAQKSFESATLIAMFEEAQATISDADSTVKALVKANEKAKHQAERYQENETLFIAEKDGMLSEISSLKTLLDMKEQSYKLMERKFQSGLLEANELALELEDGIRLLQNLLSEKLEFVSSDVKWMKEKFQHFAELARTWLEENWLEIIGKDCAISVLHLCHMGILLERITGLNAENGFLQSGLSESNSLISKLREHNDQAKNELEICSVLKGKLLFDINNSFSRITKKEQEATELNSRIDSFEKKILHLQLQEEAMVQRSNSMYTELSILIQDIDAMKRSALAAESKEKEKLRHQLDEALLLNAMLKDKMLMELNLIQMNSSIPSIDITDCNEFDLCNSLADYRSDLVMTTMITKDIESTVLAFELRQHKLYLQEQRVMFADVLEGLMAEATLWKVDQDLENIAICVSHGENNDIRTSLENLKQISEEAMKNLHAMNEENTKLNYLVPSLESSIMSFQTNLDAKNKALEELECSHAAVSKELELKTKAINLSTTREKCLSAENETLKQKILNILCKEQSMVEVMATIEVDKSLVTIESRFQQVTDHVDNYVNEQINIMNKLSNELDIIQVSAEELSTQNSLLQSELIRKDELAKGLSFDLSLLQESASVAKDQSSELLELRKLIESLEQELASKSLELDDVVSDRKQLEARILKSNENVATLGEELEKKLDELNIVSVENAELKSQLQHLEEISYAMEELAGKSEAIGRLEEELVELRSLIDERNVCFQSLQNDFSKLSDEKQCCDTQLLILKEKLEMAQAFAEESEAIATESRQIAEEQKVYAEEKDEEVKLLERSIEELEDTVCALESKVDIVKEEAERQRMLREELEVELQKVRQQMLTVPPSGNARSHMEDGMVDLADSSRHLTDMHNDLLCAQESIRVLEKEVSEKESEIAQCKAHISELNIHAEAAAREYKQKLMELEAMAQQVKTDNSLAHACSTRQEKISSKPRGSGSPFKCIGIGFVQQMNSEKDEELSAAKQRIVELEGIAASRQREIFMLNSRLATTESMTHDVIRDMLGVKMNMTTWAALADNQKKIEPTESAISQEQEIEESNELIKLRKQLDEFVEERQSWLDEINQKQSELGAARINIEKLRQREHFMVTEIELLKAENSNYKTIILNLEDEVKKLTRQQNLQLRINHHVKTKEENILLKRQNEELSAKLQQLGAILIRTKEELARYRVTNGKDPYEQIEEEQLLRKKLDESEQDRSKLAENLSSLCTSILKVAGVVNPESGATLLKALECLNKLQCRIPCLESEVEDLKLKCKLLREKARLSELHSDSSSLSSGARDGSTHMA
nr:unnamed protein product [Digitaria exilis]